MQTSFKNKNQPSLSLQENRKLAPRLSLEALSMKQISQSWSALCQLWEGVLQTSLDENISRLSEGENIIL